MIHNKSHLLSKTCNPNNIPFAVGSSILLHRGSAHCLVGWLLITMSTNEGQWWWLIQGSTWIWLGIFGSLMFLTGGFTNLIKVFKMQQMNGIRLEKLRGGAHERLVSSREGRVPLIIERQTISHEPQETKITLPVPTPTPYKDILIGSANSWLMLSPPVSYAPHFCVSFLTRGAFFMLL